MKKVWLFVLVMVFALFAGETYNSSSVGKYADSRILFRESMAVGRELVAGYETNDMEISKIDMDLVSRSSPKQTLKTLSTNYTYAISAVGQPSRIKDLDIEIFYIYNGTTTLVAKDKLVDNNPAVIFKPYMAGTYVIQVSVAQMIEGFEDQMGFYFLVVGHD